MPGSGPHRGPSKDRGTRPAIAVIPARWASSRFPGKPLADLLGAPMIARVAERVLQSEAVFRVVVATDDDRIAAAAKAHQLEVVFTSEACASGTDRVAEAVAQLGIEDALIVNVQGDEPLIDPRDIDVLVEATLASPHGMGTLARPLPEPERFADPNVVKVVLAADGRALYFSRAPVPHGGVSQALLHIGLYAYRPEVLARLTALPPSALEKTERLEQLRALENGISIQVALARSPIPSIAIDTPEDVERVLTVLRSDSTRSAHAPR